MNTNKFLSIVLFSLLTIFGCDDGVNNISPDGGIFADSDVSPDLNVEDDLGVDSDVPPVDLGVDSDVVADLGVEDSDVVSDLGTTLDLGSDLSVPPADLGTPDVGVDAGTSVVNQYYVWIASVSWSNFDTAEALCAARGGHFPVVPNTTQGRFEAHSEIVAAINELRPPGLDCEYPANVNDCSTWCINNQLGNFACESSCVNDTTDACVFHRVIPHSKNLVATVSWVDGLGNEVLRVFNTGTNTASTTLSVAANTTNLICVLPETGDFSAGVGLPDYVGVLSAYYTNL